MRDALAWMVQREKIRKMPQFNYIAAVSVGIYRNQVVLDLDYAEDVLAETDMNVVMNEEGNFIELQGTAEDKCFSPLQLQGMLELAQSGLPKIIALQKQSLEE